MLRNLGEKMKLSNVADVFIVREKISYESPEAFRTKAHVNYGIIIFMMRVKAV